MIIRTIAKSIVNELCEITERYWINEIVWVMIIMLILYKYYTNVQNVFEIPVNWLESRIADSPATLSNKIVLGGPDLLMVRP